MQRTASRTSMIGLNRARVASTRSSLCAIMAAPVSRDIGRLSINSRNAVRVMLGVVIAVDRLLYVNWDREIDMPMVRAR